MKKTLHDYAVERANEYFDEIYTEKQIKKMKDGEKNIIIETLIEVCNMELQQMCFDERNEKIKKMIKEGDNYTSYGLILVLDKFIPENCIAVHPITANNRLPISKG